MTPVVKPLSLWRRNIVFGTLLLAFLVALPSFIFYAAGYRFDFSTQTPNLLVTGGFYIAADTLDSVIYINEVPVQNVRTFRSASYIQGLVPGVQRVHVQAPGTHTWVKELTVYPQIVTEAEAFNLPLIPQVRLVTPYLTDTNRAVVFSASSSAPVLSGFASTSDYLVATGTATSSFETNQEYTLLANLFAEQASTTAYQSLQASQEVDEATFGFRSSATTSPVTTDALAATTTKESAFIRLYQVGEDIFASPLKSDSREIPHYFCFEQALVEKIVPVANPTLPVEKISNVVVHEPVRDLCRSSIMMDRKEEKVLGFNFYPQNPNLVLLHLTSGVYVVEIDDRSWQNTQPLYRGENIAMLVYRGGVFIREAGLIFEVLPEIPN